MLFGVTLVTRESCGRLVFSVPLYTESRTAASWHLIQHLEGLLVRVSQRKSSFTLSTNSTLDDVSLNTLSFGLALRDYTVPDG